jgi:hypothetical protein
MQNEKLMHGARRCFTVHAMQEQLHAETRSRNHCSSGKATSLRYSECASVVLVIQDATRVRRTILSSVSCLALPYFSTLSLKRYDSGIKKISKRILIFSKTSVWNTLILRIQWDVINEHRSLCKVPIILVTLKQNVLSRNIIGKYSNIRLHENPSSLSRYVHCG